MNDAAARLPEIDVVGRGLAAGRAYGEEMRALIGDHLALLRARLAKLGAGPDELQRRAAPFRAATMAVAPDLASEIDGVGDGCGGSTVDGWLLQLRAELTIGRHEDIPECTTLAVVGAASRDGPLAAQNVDLPPGYRDLLVLLRRRVPGEPALATVTPAGQIGHHGLNSAGVGVVANFLQARGWRAGVPRYLLTRIALACRSRAEAAAAIERTPRAGPRNLLLIDDGGAIDLETTPGAIDPIEPDADLIVHANHFVGELSEHDAAADDWLANSRTRLARGWEMARAGALHDVDSLQRLLASRADAPHAICHHQEDAPDIDYATVAATVAEVSARRLWVCIGPPDRGSFAFYEVDP